MCVFWYWYWLGAVYSGGCFPRANSSHLMYGGMTICMSCPLLQDSSSLSHLFWLCTHLCTSVSIADNTPSPSDTIHTSIHMYPPPPMSRNHLAQEPTPGSAVEFSHHFFYQGSGFFMFLVDVGQLFRCAGHHFMCVTTGPPIRGDPISHSQAHIPLKAQHRSPAPRGSTDRNSGWCITRRRVLRLSQLNIRRARWQAHYSPVS